ncbi:MAG TPA: Trk system potassium transporter TrkA [Gammaproteobacteria bacterium]|nr:Trk system potassium transporter TrkA [Gammaproteobacteria bacterium]|tara:strand:+ start:3740 stop:5113 length:1374 start_codon:yes stop_codon:yes gene_type:complete
MKILILGAGQVGGTLAENLAKEDFDITLVDEDPVRLQELASRLDIQTVEGFASHPEVLERAGADDADILVAVTSSDEVNMIACQTCFTLFRTPTKIARIRSSAYLNQESLFARNSLPIDRLIHPEQVVTGQIRDILDHPGALEVLDFADGRVQLVAMKAYADGPLIGRALNVLPQHMPKVDARVAAIFRNGQPIIPEGNTVIEVDDEVFFIAARKDINAVMSELRKAEKPFKRIMIAGGGNIGARLAASIEGQYTTKVLEQSKARSMVLAEILDTTVVINGSATDRDLLLEENIEECDVFCAVTNDDEVNIMSALMAKRLGVRQVISLIAKPAYLDLVQGGEIDLAISPQQATIGTLLSHVRRADVARVHSLRRGAAEAMEAIAHGDVKTSKVVGRRLSEIDLPDGTTIGAIVRDEEVLIAHHDVVIQPDDHVILFLVDKRQIAAVERLFQVSLSFF